MTTLSVRRIVEILRKKNVRKYDKNPATCANVTGHIFQRSILKIEELKSFSSF